MFTDAEKLSISRHCGYRMRGTYPDGRAFSNLTREAYLESRLTDSTEAEQDLVRTKYLANLELLEADIFAARENLDTDEAAVWKRNKTELKERMKLYASWRLRLCSFLDVQPGPDIGFGSSGSLRIIV